jgi:hypothetical protein
MRCWIVSRCLRKNMTNLADWLDRGIERISITVRASCPAIQDELRNTHPDRFLRLFPKAGA